MIPREYHSDNYKGIGDFLKEINPELRIVTISTISQVDPFTTG